jgi:predicted GNAT family N-acyltransferase
LGKEEKPCSNSLLYDLLNYSNSLFLIARDSGIGRGRRVLSHLLYDLLNLFELCFSVQVVEAKKLYVELDKEKKNFGLEHCWKILKGEDKWKAKMIELAELEKEKQAAKKKRRLLPRKRGRGRKKRLKIMKLKKLMLKKPHQRKGQKG